MRYLVTIIVCAIATISQASVAQISDIDHSIRFSTVLAGPAVYNQIISEMSRQNIAVTSELPHAIAGMPLDAADVQIRVNIAPDSAGLTVLIFSAVATGGGGGFVYPGTGGSSSPTTFPVDKGTHRGKEWKRLEALSSALRAVLAPEK